MKAITISTRSGPSDLSSTPDLQPGQPSIRSRIDLIARPVTQVNCAANRPPGSAHARPGLRRVPERSDPGMRVGQLMIASRSDIPRSVHAIVARQRTPPGISVRGLRVSEVLERHREHGVEVPV